MPVPDTLSRISDDDPQWYAVGNLDSDYWCLLRVKDKIFISSFLKKREELHTAPNDPMIRGIIRPINEEIVLLTLLKYGISI